MNRKFLFLITLLLLTACGKKQTIRITAVNPATGEPWSGLRYTITKQKTGAFEEKYKIIDEGFLNDNGKAETEVRMRNASYEINIEDPGNTCYVNNTSYTFSKNNSNYDVTFEMVPCAYLKWDINNINCQGNTDTLRFRKSTNYGQGDAWSTKRSGCYQYLSPEYFTVPMGTTIVEWEVTRNGSTNTYSDTIYLNELQEYTYPIYY